MIKQIKSIDRYCIHSLLFCSKNFLHVQCLKDFPMTRNMLEMIFKAVGQRGGKCCKN